MSNLRISKYTVAYNEGKQAFKDGLEVLDDNPYNTKNIFGALPSEWFQWYEGYDDAYRVNEKALDEECGIMK